MLKDFLQGKPFQAPLHPALIHFPIGLFVLSLILDIASYLDKTTNWLVPAAASAMAGGILMAVLAAIPGLVDWSDIRTDHPAKKKATLHMILNLSIVAVYALNLGLRSGDLSAPSTPLIPFLLSILAVGTLMISGFIGGVLIYELGIAVGRHRRHPLSD